MLILPVLTSSVSTSDSESRADHAKGCELELAGLLPRGVRSVIGNDHVDGTVDDALTNGFGVLVGAQRRIDLERGVVGLVQVVLGQEHVVRGGLAGNLNASGLTGTHDLQTMGGGDVLDVQLGAGQLGDLDVAGDLELLAGSRPTLEGQTGRDLALVDLPWPTRSSSWQWLMKTLPNILP